MKGFMTTEESLLQNDQKTFINYIVYILEEKLMLNQATLII